MRKHLNLPSKANWALAFKWQLPKQRVYIYPWLRTDHGHKESAFNFSSFFVKIGSIGVWNVLRRFETSTSFQYLPPRSQVFFCWTFINLSQLTARQWQYHNDDAQHLTRSATTQMMMPGTNTQVAAELPCHWPWPQMTARQRREMEGSSNENGPKRCQTHCLGHRYVF